ncbi:MAG TPA: hypothetical protein VGM44_15620, partial [Polyangiaceae bacterium]
MVEPSDAEHGSSLVFESNFDTDDANPYTARVAQLELLCARVFEPLAGVFRDCEGFAEVHAANALAEALEAHLVESTACYQGHTDRDLPRIRLERHLREILIDYFSRAPKAPLRELYHAAREHVLLRAAYDPELAGLELDAPAPKNPDQKLRSQRLAAGIIVWFQNLSFDLFVYLLFQLRKLKHWTESDPEFDQRAVQEAWTDADRAEFLALAANEDHGLQNALTHVVPLKGGNRL